MASLLDRITVDPHPCGGRPCIRGLRIRVKDILDALAGGSSRTEILSDYTIWRITRSRPRRNSHHAPLITPSSRPPSCEISCRCESASGTRAVARRLRGMRPGMSADLGMQADGRPGNLASALAIRAPAS